MDDVGFLWTWQKNRLLLGWTEGILLPVPTEKNGQEMVKKWVGSNNERLQLFHPMKHLTMVISGLHDHPNAMVKKSQELTSGGSGQICKPAGA
jgi:hypothetical protein